MNNATIESAAISAASQSNFNQDLKLSALAGWEIIAADWAKGKLRDKKFTDHDIGAFLLGIRSIQTQAPLTVHLDKRTKKLITESLCALLRIRITNAEGEAIHASRLLRTMGEMLHDLNQYNNFTKIEDSQNWVVARIRKAREATDCKRITICFGLPADKSVIDFRRITNLKEFVTNNWHGQRPAASEVKSPIVQIPVPVRVPLPKPVSPPAPLVPTFERDHDGFAKARPIQPKPRVTTPIALPQTPTTFNWSPIMIGGVDNALPARAAVQPAAAPTAPKVRPETAAEFAARLGIYLKPTFDQLQTAPDFQSAIIDIIRREKLDYSVANETVNGAPRINLYALRQSLAQVLGKLAIEIDSVSKEVTIPDMRVSPTPEQKREYDGALIKEKITKIMLQHQPQCATSLSPRLVDLSRNAQLR